MPVAQPTASAAPRLPTKTFSYDYLLQPKTVTDTVTDASGTVLARRTTTTTYANNGWAPRPITTTVASTDGVAVPDITRAYDPATGLPTTISSSTTAENPAGTITIGYDDFGRQTSYTDADGNQATTTYNGTTGRVDSEQNARGIISYTYRGGGEHRDMPTGMTVSGLSGQFTASYDADGQLTSQQLPNGLTQAFTRDTTGQTTGLKDNVAGQPTDWLSDTVTPTVHGQWADEHATTGTKTYSYDGLGRLTVATDTPATTDPTAATATTPTATDSTNRRKPAPPERPAQPHPSPAAIKSKATAMTPPTGSRTRAPTTA
jgi:YD repeat-containing protein